MLICALKIKKIVYTKITIQYKSVQRVKNKIQTKEKDQT